MSDGKILDAHFTLCELCPYCIRERSYKRDLNGTVVMLPDICDDRLRCDREVKSAAEAT